MSKTASLVAICAVVFGPPAWADVDLRDFDDDLMRTLGDDIKLLEPDITAKNVRVAGEEIAEFRDGFKWVEAYFAAKRNAEDAVKFARESQSLTDAVSKALAANNFEAAAAAARDLSKSCKNCHDAYKPP